MMHYSAAFITQSGFSLLEVSSTMPYFVCSIKKDLFGFQLGLGNMDKIKHHIILDGIPPAVL